MSHPRRTLTQRAALVQQWKDSGLSALIFARRHGFVPPNLPRWAARLPPASTPSALTFVRLETAPSPAVLLVEVGAARVRVAPGFDPALLRNLSMHVRHRGKDFTDVPRGSWASSRWPLSPPRRQSAQTSPAC